MSDARWEDVEADIAGAAAHFRNAVALWLLPRAAPGSLDRYRDDMAFMHAMQAGHTSAEAGLLRVLDILGEEPPSGEHWHRDLIDRLGRPANGAHARPPLLSAALRADLHETRNFRHRAMHSYGEFDAARAAPAQQAAERLAAALPGEVGAFRRVVDPEEPG